MAEKLHLGGVTNTTVHLETDGSVIVEEKQDAEGILDYTAAARNNRFDASACEGMLRHEAEIPMTVYIHECRKRGITPLSPEADIVIELILADPQYAKLRAAPTLTDPRIIMKGRR